MGKTFYLIGSNSPYFAKRVGNINKLRIVELNKPPTIMEAIGPSISRPGSPLPNIRGNNPSAVTIAIVFTGGWLSIGSLVGFVTLFGITIRNSIMLTSHYQHLVKNENLPWNFATAALGASQRLPSILMTAIVTALGLLPLILGSGEPGREIEGPMASIIVGGLFSSTILNLLVLPTLLAKHGNFDPIK